MQKLYIIKQISTVNGNKNHVSFFSDVKKNFRKDVMNVFSECWETDFSKAAGFYDIEEVTKFAQLLHNNHFVSNTYIVSRSNPNKIIREVKTEKAEPATDLFKDQNIILYPECIKNLESGKWDNIEVSPIYDDGKGNAEVCEKGQESYYSLYLHNVTGGVVCVADCKTEEDADKLFQFLKLSALSLQTKNYLTSK